MKEKKEISKKIKEIFKRILAFTGSAATFLLPGCDAAQQQDNKYNEDERTSFVESLREDVPTTESELDKIVEQGTLDNNKETITESNTHSTIVDNLEEEKALYNKLLNNFNKEFNKKEFSEKAYIYMKEIFDNMFGNYDKWKQINKDLPSKEKYITDNLINNIKHIRNINFYAIDSKEAQEGLDNGYGLAYTNSDFEITVIYDESSEKNFDIEVLRLAHELEHIDQKNIAFNSNYFEEYPYMRDILVEGGASSKMKYMSKPKAEKISGYLIESENYTLEYKNDTGEGYPLEMNLYDNIMSLVGYDLMEKIDSGEQPIESIKSAIERRYGAQTANKVFTELENLYNAKEENNNKAQMEAAVYLQKEFLGCIEKDIDKLQNKEDVIKYTNIYRSYKINNLAKVYRNNNEITDEYFNIEKIDKKMTDKINQTKAFDLCEDKEENEKALRCLLYTTNQYFYQKDGIYQGIYITPNLYDTSYEYINGKLILYYENVTEYEPAKGYKLVEMQIDNSDEVQVKETNEKSSNLKPIIKNVVYKNENIR